jgi:DNA-binding transcriptional regulator YhcF (GntR family)
MPDPSASRLESASPLPLYHQIAEALRYAIATGRLKEGQYLTPVRQAAREWKVNLHTVRRAYAALAGAGLVETRVPFGSRILARKPARPARSAERRAFARRVLREAAERFDLSAEELVALLSGATEPAVRELPVVHVVECSRAQCLGHARELEGHWQVEARPWPLSRRSAPPAGPVVATYFHYNDVRRRWPARLGAIRFTAIRPDPEAIERIVALEPRLPRTLILFELDQAMAENIASDLTPMLPRGRFKLRTRVVAGAADAGDGLVGLGANQLALFSPRVWAKLTPRQRAYPRAFGVRYVFAPGELAALGSDFGWQPRGAALARGVS